MSDLKSLDKVKADFEECGVSVSQWAREHGVSAPLVYQVLSGRRKAVRGESHRIAVLLGLKKGTIAAASQLTVEEYRK